MTRKIYIRKSIEYAEPLFFERMRDCWNVAGSYSLSKGSGNKRVAATLLARYVERLSMSKGRLGQFLGPPEKANAYHLVISIIDKQFKKFPGE
jgi:hypothetical protein